MLTNRQERVYNWFLINPRKVYYEYDNNGRWIYKEDHTSSYSKCGYAENNVVVFEYNKWYVVGTLEFMNIIHIQSKI